jgi:hypothetical protein
VVAIAIVGCLVVIPESRNAEHPGLDYVGLLLSIVGVLAVVDGIIQAPERGWTSASAFSLLLSVATTRYRHDVNLTSGLPLDAQRAAEGSIGEAAAAAHHLAGSGECYSVCVVGRRAVAVDRAGLVGARASAKWMSVAVAAVIRSFQNSSRPRSQVRDMRITGGNLRSAVIRASRTNGALCPPGTGAMPDAG